MHVQLPFTPALHVPPRSGHPSYRKYHTAGQTEVLPPIAHFGAQPEVKAISWETLAPQWIQFRKVRNTFQDFVLDLNLKQFVQEAFPELTGKQILELGSGDGYFTRWLAQQGAQVTGLDISSSLLAHAQHQSNNLQEEIHYAMGDMQDAGHSVFQTPTYDGVFASMVLMYSAPLSQVFHNVYQALKPGGHFVFAVKHPFSQLADHYVDGLQGTPHKQPLQPYFNRTPYPKSIGLTGNNIITPLFYPHTVEDYVQGVIDSGFTLYRIHEPEPLPGAEDQAEFRNRFQWTRSYPGLLFVDAMKPHSIKVQDNTESGFAK